MRKQPETRSLFNSRRGATRLRSGWRKRHRKDPSTHLANERLRHGGHYTRETTRPYGPHTDPIDGGPLYRDPANGRPVHPDGTPCTPEEMVELGWPLYAPDCDPGT